MGKSERLLLLEQELRRYINPLSEASDIIIDEGVSNYPIFVAHQEEINIGIPTLDKQNSGGTWNINSSSLEEFVVKRIIHEDKIDGFKSNYKDPSEFVCIFVLSELGAKFVYLPKDVK